MECVVQGIIETQHVDALEILLQGLCGVPKEQVRVHELCLKSGPNLGVVPSEIRLLCDLAHPTPSWTVRHVGGAMRGAGAEQISVLVRTVVESKVSNNVLRFFYGLGYKLDHEILKRKLCPSLRTYTWWRLQPLPLLKIIMKLRQQFRHFVNT